MGVSGGSSKGGGGNRGRPYGVMLILAVGAAVFAVMVLHKMRERRIFNILISEKDHNLITLQLLLQKERDSATEMKRKIEELKTKTHLLRTQKMELNDKLMEMQSISSSLREEQRTLESALDEKQNEIKMLREKEKDSSKDTYQVTSLKELLKLKEAEIKEMKHQLEKPRNVWSVSTDDPSKPPGDFTGTEISGNAENGTDRKGDNANTGESQSEGALDSNNGEAVTTKGEVGSRSATQSTEHKKIPTEAQLQKQENSQVGEGLRERSDGGNKHAADGQGQEEVSGDTQITKNGNSHDGRDATAEVSSLSDGVLKKKNEGSDTRKSDGRDHKTPQDINSQVLSMISNGGMNLEEPARSQKAVISRLKEEYSRRSIMRGRRRRRFSRDVTKNSEDGSSETRHGKTTNEGKPEGKLWRTIHVGRQSKERNSEYLENSNPNRSENRDFSDNGGDQTMDADDDDESANIN